MCNCNNNLNRVEVTQEGFLTQFPEFNTESYLELIPVYLERAQVYCTTVNFGRLKNDKRILAIYLLTAHLLTLANQAKNGASGQGGLVASASVGSVSVSYVQIPNLNQFDYWLSLSPYGMQLLTLLDILSSVPFYIGGSYERVF